MKDEELDLAERLSPSSAEQTDRVDQPAPDRPTIHYTQLPEAIPGSKLAREWNFYRQVAGRLLAEGHESRWVLIKNEAIVGIWDTEQEGTQERLRHFPREDALLQQIREQEPIHLSGAYFRRWRN